MNSLDTIYKAKEAFGTPVSLMIGAGISVPLPTGLPLHTEIVRSLMRLDWFEGEEKFPITDERLIETVSNSLRLEHIFSIFYEWWEHDPGKLILQFKDAEPNWYHHQIADLVEAGIIKDIYTTNFDLCIEKALLAQSIPFKQIINQSDLLTTPNDHIKVVKLHGSSCKIEDLLNEDATAHGLITTLESMSKGGIEPWKANLLRDSIETNGIICLGYSGKDFDINPNFREITHQKILWVNHTCESNNDEITHTLQYSRFGSPVCIDTAIFLGESKTLSIKKNEFRFTETYSAHEMLHPSCFLGRLLEYCHDYNSASVYYQEVFEKSNGSNYYLVSIIDIARSMMVCNFHLNKFDQSLEWGIICEKLLNYYKNTLIDNAEDQSAKFFSNIIMQQELLLSEEMCLLYDRYGNFVQYEVEESKLFNIIQAGLAKNALRSSDISRLLVNFSSIYLKKIQKGEVYDIDYYFDLEASLKLAEKVKKSDGEIYGIALIYQILIDYYCMLGNVDMVKLMFQKFIPVARQLNSPISDQHSEFIKTYMNVIIPPHSNIEIQQRIQDLLLIKAPSEKVVDGTIWPLIEELLTCG
ncbi:SIR2 family protein [Candidatus Nomurabacteria bacterium]|nr:SIR2 family protein [Candidatus Nomurabacteria bacterium]